MKMIIYKEPIENYHANAAISHSKLEVYRKCPLLFKKVYLEKSVQKEETDALRLGSAVHCRLLDGLDDYNLRYCVTPSDAPRRPTMAMINARNPSEETKAACLFWSTWDSVHGHKEALSVEEQATVNNACESFWETKLDLNGRSLKEYVAECETEVGFRASFCQAFQTQCRTDIWDGANHVMDLKTVRDFDQFEYNFHHFGYHRQAAFYRNLISNNLRNEGDRTGPEITFRFCVIELKEPFRVGLFEPAADAVAAGGGENTRTLQKMKESFEKDCWPGAHSGIQVMNLPPWYYSKLIKGEMR